MDQRKIRHIQSKYQLGITGCSAKPISNWVSQAAQPSQYTIWFDKSPAKPISFGFHRMLRKWKGRTAKLVRSSIELRTPSQYLSGRETPWSTLPTQGSVPLSTPQSLGLPLPFQLSSGCAEQVHQPLLSYCEVPHQVYQAHSTSLPLLSLAYSSNPKPGCTTHQPQCKTR